MLRLWRPKSDFESLSSQVCLDAFFLYIGINEVSYVRLLYCLTCEGFRQQDESGSSVFILFYMTHPS